MSKTSRFLIKMIFIVLVCILMVIAFKLTGLKVTLLMFFFIFLGKTWGFGLNNVELNSQLDDYYSLFKLEHSFNKHDLQVAYDNEINRLNNDPSIGIEDRLHLMGLLNTAFDTLNNTDLKSDYDKKYNLMLEEINVSKLKNDEINNNVEKYIMGLIKHNLYPFINFKLLSFDTIGLLSCLILDLVFILGISR